MKKFLKIFGIVILIVLITLIVSPLFFKDKIVEMTKTEINNQVNAKVDFGDFGLSIFRYFPNLNFEINDLSVSGINKFEADTLMQIKQLSVKVNLLSVLRDEIEVLGIHLIEPNIYAHVLADSSANWDIAKESKEVEEEVQNDDESESPFKLALKSFSIKKADIVYQDESSSLFADIHSLDYDLGGDFSLSNAKLDMALLIEAITVEMENVKYLNKANVEYVAGIQADLDQMKFDLLDNQLRLNKLILALAGYVQINQDDSYTMDLSFNTNENRFKDLLSLVPTQFMQDIEGVKTTGLLKLNGFAKGVYAQTQIPAFNLNLNVDNATVQYPDLPASVKDIYIDLILDNKDGIDDHTVVDLKRFDLNIADNPFSAKYIAKTPISDPYIRGVVKGKIDFEKLKEALPLDSINLKGLMQIDVDIEGNLSSIEKEQYDQFKAVGKVSLDNFLYQAVNLDYDVLVEKAEMEVSSHYFKMPSFHAKVGKSDFHANGDINNILNYYFKDETLVGTFNLTSSLIDGTELAGGESTEEETVGVDTASASMEVIELPKNIDFELNTKIDKIFYDIYKIDNFKGNVQLKEGIAKMQDVQMEMIGGFIKMKGSYDSRNLESPEIDFGLSINQLSIVEAFKTFVTVQKLAPIAESCKGQLDMDLDIKSVLDSNMEPILNTLNGAGKIKSNNIAIAGSDAIKTLAALLHSDKYKEIKLKNVNAMFTIEDGNIDITPFDVAINQSKATFGGKQGVDQTIDYQLDMAIPKSELGNANKLAKNMLAKGGALTQNVDLGDALKASIFITGTLQKPHFSIGAKDMVKNATEQVKEKVKEKVEEVLDQAKSRAIKEAQEQADKLLQEANKQSDKLNAEAEKQATKIRKNGKFAADKVREEAQKEIDKLVKKAGSNPIAKVAAKKTGEKLKKEADLKANELQKEANNKADQLVSETKNQTDEIKRKAKEEGNKLIAEAERK